MNIIVSGGRGFIGKTLVPELQSAGHTVAVWSRSPEEETRAGVRAFAWDPVAGPPPAESLEGMDAVIHLSGESVAHKWTPEVKKKIRTSRIEGTRNLVSAIARLDIKPKALICASATGYYGDRGEEELVEFSAAGRGFLADLCQDWEREAGAATELGVRVVKIRTGMVLGAGGGALARLVPAFQTKMGGKLGSGKQWMPWIHLSDISGLYRHAVEHDAEGVWNGTAPHPCRNEEFTEVLGNALEQPTKLSVPEFALKMMFGEMADMMLCSQKVRPQAAELAGYPFRFPEIGPALQDAVREA